MSMIMTQPVKTETKPVINETKTEIPEKEKKVVSLILTHQARIRCFMDMIIKGKRGEKKEGFIDKIKKNRQLNNSIIAVKNTINKTFNKNPVQYKYQEEEEEKRFKNCSFLRLCLNKETGICIQLVYGGELDPGEGKGGRIYYITNDVDNKKQIGGDNKMPKFISAMSLTFKKKDVSTEEEDDDTKITKIIEEIFTNINAGINRLQLSNDIFKDVDEYVFYIGRHGQAEHNLKNATHLKTDTDVTDLGKEQAFRAGQHLSAVLKNNKENISYVFASDLIRTRQTIENIIKGMNQAKDSFFPKEIVILPCSHELKYNSQGLCDKKPSSFSLKIGTKENNPKCSKTTHCIENNITNPDSDCNRIQIIDEDSKNKIVRKIPLQWDFYFEKNENKMRKMDCSKTNMIQLAIEYINTSGPIKFNQSVVIPIPIKASDGPSPPKETLNTNDVCLIDCFKKVFNIGSEINYSTMKDNQNFKNIREYFQGVKKIGDLKNKTYDEFIKTYKYTGDVVDKYKDIFDQFVQCLSETCLEKNIENEILSPTEPDNKTEPDNNNIPPPPPTGKSEKVFENQNDKDKSVKENKNNQINSPLYWTQGFKNNSVDFYKNIRSLGTNNETQDLFDKVMEKIIESPENFYKMIDTYLNTEDNNKDTNITFIKDYLSYRLKGNDKNAENFMNYIKTKDNDLYNSILKYKEWYDRRMDPNKKGGKKTRKNRKDKKRFLKRTKRNHKKSKTRRIRRKII